MAIERVIDNISHEEDQEEQAVEVSLRPTNFAEYIGQERLKKNLKIAIAAVKKRNDGTTLDHVLLYGPPGLGKTTMANVIAHELGSNLRVTSGPAIERAGDLASILTNLQKIRNAYNQRIRLAIPQQVCLYACRIGETALDTESGALYIQTLLWQAKLFPNNEEFRTVEEIHKNASELTYIKGLLKKHTQHPAASLPKCLTSQKLILSINPNRI